MDELEKRTENVECLAECMKMEQMFHCLSYHVGGTRVARLETGTSDELRWWRGENEGEASRWFFSRLLWGIVPCT